MFCVLVFVDVRQAPYRMIRLRRTCKYHTQPSPFEVSQCLDVMSVTVEVSKEL